MTLLYSYSFPTAQVNYVIFHCLFWAVCVLWLAEAFTTHPHTRWYSQSRTFQTFLSYLYVYLSKAEYFSQSKFECIHLHWHWHSIFFIQHARKPFAPFQCWLQRVVFHLKGDFLSNFELILIIWNLSLWGLYYTAKLWNTHVRTTLGCSFTCYKRKIN